MSSVILPLYNSLVSANVTDKVKVGKNSLERECASKVAFLLLLGDK